MHDLSENVCLVSCQFYPHSYWHAFLYTALLQTPTTSDVIFVCDSVQGLQGESWQELAGHLGFSGDYIESVHDGWRRVPMFMMNSFKFIGAA